MAHDRPLTEEEAKELERELCDFIIGLVNEIKPQPTDKDKREH